MQKKNDRIARRRTARHHRAPTQESPTLRGHIPQTMGASILRATSSHLHRKDMTRRCSLTRTSRHILASQRILAVPLRTIQPTMGQTLGPRNQSILTSNNKRLTFLLRRESHSKNTMKTGATTTETTTTEMTI